MKQLLTILILCFMPLAGQAAQVGTLKITDVLGSCEAEPRAQQNWCLGYIFGILQSLQEVGLVCGVEEVTMEQQRRVVVKYLNDHPEDLHQHPLSQVQKAFIGAFPCKKK